MVRSVRSCVEIVLGDVALCTLFDSACVSGGLLIVLLVVVAMLHNELPTLTGIRAKQVRGSLSHPQLHLAAHHEQPHPQCSAPFVSQTRFPVVCSGAHPFYSTNRSLFLPGTLERRQFRTNISPGKSPGASPATRSIDSASAYDMLIPLLRHSIMRWQGQD